MESARITKGARRVGRYAVFEEIASGGMATVYLGRLIGDSDVTRTVAIKCLHPHFAKDPEVIAMFLDEARVAARLHHPNIVAVLDFVSLEGELFLVLEYVHGTSAAHLLRCRASGRERIPDPVVASIMTGVLHGLHAAHEAKDERDVSLGVVHRDVTPHNVIVGADGISRIVDFGIARAMDRLQTTRDGQMKGKTSYLAPEQILERPLDARTDVYAAGVVLVELLTGCRLFAGDSAGSILAKIMVGASDPPSVLRDGVDERWDAIAMRALSLEPGERYRSALAMALAIEEIVAPASPHRVGEWVRSVAKDELARLERMNRRLAALSIGELVQPFERAAVSSAAGAGAPDEAAATGRRGGTRALTRRWAAAGLVALASGAAIVVGAATGRARVDSRVAKPSVAMSAAAASSGPSPEATLPASAPAAAARVAAPDRDAQPSRPPATRDRPSGFRPRVRRQGCENPFFTDSNGIEHLRKACF